MAGCGQLVALLALAVAAATGTRVILDPKTEPTMRECHNIYRLGFADPVHWSLANAGLLNATNIDDQYLDSADNDSDGKQFVKTDFKYSSLKALGWLVKLEYMIPLEERLALHVYDDVRDLQRAAGPQVNQEMCGLHLGYMQRMVEKHLVNFRNSTDYSIFSAMHSSDGPNYAIDRANTLYFGNYHQCVATRLNVMRDELSKVNRSASDAFFQSRQKPIREASLIERFATSFGPLVGYLAQPEHKLVVENQHRIQLLPMRYCVAAIRYPEWRNDSFSRRNMNLRVAICLPETCDSQSVGQYRDQIKRLVDFNIKQFYAGYYLDELYCLPDERSELRNPFNYSGSTLFICFNGVWFSLVLLATGVSLYKRHQPGRGNISDSLWWHYLSCWCLPKNYNQLMNYERTTVADASQQVNNSHYNELDSGGEEQQVKTRRTNKVDLGPMEGFKVLSALAVIASHATMIVFSNNWNQMDGHRLLSRTWVSAVNTVYPAVVDNFFVATGILTVGVLMRMPRKQLETKLFWPVFVVYRYLRIVPLYALVHWFVQTYFRFLGSGPKWDYGTSRSAWISMCQNESLWELIVPMANFKSASRHCNHVGWYLANDIQFCLLVPIFTLIYLKNHRMGHLAIGLSSLLVCANHIWYYLSVGGDARSVFEPSMIMLAQITDEVWAGYVMPQYRCLAFLIGMAAGHVLVRYERDEIGEWPRWFLIGGKLFIALNAYVLCLMPFLSYLVPLDNEWLVLVLGSVVSGSMHGVTSIAAALFILFLCTGHLPNVARLFGLAFLKPLASAALSCLLIHIPLQYYHSQSLTYLPQLSAYNLVTTIVIWCMESYALSIVVHLVYEMPLRKILLKIMLGLLSERSSNNHQSSTISGKQEQVSGDRSTGENIALHETKVARKDS